MSNKELKQFIHEKVDSVDDDILLEEVYRILQISTTKDQIFVFSDKQLNELDEIEAEMDRGLFFTQEEADKDLETWLKK